MTLEARHLESRTTSGTRPLHFEDVALLVLVRLIVAVKRSRNAMNFGDRDVDIDSYSVLCTSYL